MRTIISNNITVPRSNRDIMAYCEKNLKFSNPEYFVAQKMGRWTGNIEKNIRLYEVRGENIVLPFGVAKKIWPYINGNFDLDFAPDIKLQMTGDIPLYTYQENAIGILKEAKNGILEAPCGSGKTQMGLGLIKELGLKALWLTHTGDLLKQSMDRAKQYFNGDFGTITGGKVEIGKDITFATVQTMTKLDLQQYAKEFSVIIVDECHRVAGTPTKVMMFYRVLSNLKARYKFGLSATLHRADALIKSTYALLGDIVHSISDERVASKIMKAKHEIVDTHITDNFEKYTDFDGTLNYIKLITYLSEHEFRNKLIANNVYLETKKYNTSLVLSARVEHLKKLKRAINNLGINCETVVGSVSKDERAKIFDRVRNGQTKVLLATYSLAKEGLDIPNLNRLHMATPQKDKAIVLQSAGRIERRIDGKKDAVILDYVDYDIPYCLKMFKKRVNIFKRR